MGAPSPAKKAAPAKRAPRKAAPQALTAPADDGVVLDLDVMEKSAYVKDAVTTPFKFRHLDVVYELLDPRDMDWRDLMRGLRNPALFMSSAMPQEQQEGFLGVELPGWKLDAIFTNWEKHFGVTGLGNLNTMLSS